MFYYVFIILFIGTLVGTTSHLAIGWLIFDRPDPQFLLARGALNGFFYSGIWAGGISIVLCFMRGHRERIERDKMREAKAVEHEQKEGSQV